MISILIFSLFFVYHCQVCFSSPSFSLYNIVRICQRFYLPLFSLTMHHFQCLFFFFFLPLFYVHIVSFCFLLSVYLVHLLSLCVCVCVLCFCVSVKLFSLLVLSFLSFLFTYVCFIKIGIFFSLRQLSNSIYIWFLFLYFFSSFVFFTRTSFRVCCLLLSSFAISYVFSFAFSFSSWDLLAGVVSIRIQRERTGDRLTGRPCLPKVRFRAQKSRFGFFLGKINDCFKKKYCFLNSFARASLFYRS